METKHVRDTGPRKKSTLDAEQKRIAAQIIEYLRPVGYSMMLLLDAQTPNAEVEVAELIELASNSWARVLIGDDQLGQPLDASATVAARRVALLAEYSWRWEHMTTEKPRTRLDEWAQFWSTELGQLVFSRGGFPDRPATAAEAAHVLGITRQGVQWNLNKGNLLAEGTRVRRASLHELFKFRQELLKRQRDKEEGKNAEDHR